MSGGNKIFFKTDSGEIIIERNGKQERVFLNTTELMRTFGEEIVNISGKDTLTTVLRKTFQKMGIEVNEKPTWESFEKLNDDLILPISLEGSDIPENVFMWNEKPWDGTTRNLTILNIIGYLFYTVESFMMLKEAMGEVLTERGRDAILRSVTRRSGKSVGELNMKFFNWTDMDTCMEGMDEAVSPFLPMVGWGKTRVITKKGQDGHYMMFMKTKNGFEAKNIKSDRATCVLQASIYDGVSEIIGNRLAGQSSEGKEVKCQAKGDNSCVLVIKFKPKNSPALDWKELESEWRELDKIDLGLE